MDYYTYGACRLAGDGAYYCGSLSTLAPYKGLTNTQDSPHIGSDPYTRHDVPTGSTVYRANQNNWPKVAQPANPEYYAKGSPHASEFVQEAYNNGQALKNPSKLFGRSAAHGVGSTKVFNQATNHLTYSPGYDPTARWDVAARASNYGMGRTTAKYYNQGIHVVGTDQVGEDGPGTGVAHTGGTRYSTAVEAPSGLIGELKDFR